MPTSCKNHRPHWRHGDCAGLTVWEAIDLYPDEQHMVSPDRPRQPIQVSNRGTCSNCSRPIWRNGSGGTWLHRISASSACYPRSSSWKHASPREVDA